MVERGAVQHGNTTIRYEVVRSRRRKKTVQLAVDGLAGVRVTAPVHTSAGELESIVRQRAPWIMRQAADPALRAVPRRFVSGESLPYLGRQVPMVMGDAARRSPAVRFRNGNFEITAPSDLYGEERRRAIRKALVRWYGERAADRLRDAVERWSPRVGHSPAGILVRDQKSRWGSCAADGTLRFNWRTMMGEPALMDYVVVHELVHLEVKNHSREFWDRVALVMPDYRERRRRLKVLAPYFSF